MCALVTGVQTCAFRSAQRMQAIVADLLTLSTLESSPHVEGEPVRMGALIHTALQQGRILSNDQHVFVENVAEDLYITGIETEQIGRASCRERVCQYV